jgi:hypothetical protein
MRNRRPATFQIRDAFFKDTGGSAVKGSTDAARIWNRMKYYLI